MGYYLGNNKLASDIWREAGQDSRVRAAATRYRDLRAALTGRHRDTKAAYRAYGNLIASTKRELDKAEFKLKETISASGTH